MNKQKVKILLSVIVFTIVVIFSLQNNITVNIKFLFFDLANFPLFGLIAVNLVLGIIVGFILSRRHNQSNY